MNGPRLRAILVATLAPIAVLGGCGSPARPFGGGGNGAGGAGAGTGGEGNGGDGSGGTASGGMTGGGAGGATGTGGIGMGGTGQAGRGGTGSGGRGGGAGAGGRGGGGGRGETGGAATGGAAAGGAGGGSPCPATPPTANAACTREGLICEYGIDPRPECRPHATCTAARWVLAATQCPAIPPVTGACPGSRDAAQGAKCGPDAAICSYGGLNCVCASCAPNGPVGCTPNVDTATWYCEAPNADPACPAVTPRLGALCPTEGKQCNYKCGPEGGRLCRSGVWIPADGGTCPRSNREVKRDIHYLDPGEIEKLAGEVARLRLATWQYKDPALAGRRHLGFIIEDQPDIAAVDKTRGIVDLYGYTSMLAAALKAQEREIEALRREVEALRALSAPRWPRAARRR